ncbi:hypothetical protein [Jeongeupia chitinilytica]|uniref:DUF1640 domain-containing protein n=1 Tax=Jeongeupia chitinilytica TaxID=1041641 RepID=A0ABQ3H1G5_9NEIS|nr:hypothetical protein [Jeongeupia chitinilytica]GHD63811.1 hypothetical protein GCM10007350_22020 [Jeongeupia chitinilytica]
MAENDNSLALMLGRMEGKLDMVLANQSAMNERVDGIEERLREVETQAAKSGALGGAIAAVGTALAVEFIKRAITG